MKIKIGESLIDRAQADGRLALNLVSRRARAEALRDMPSPQRKLFTRDYHKARSKVFKDFGLVITGRLVTREEGRAFLSQLAPTKRVELQKAISEEVKKIATRMKLLGVVELEDLRQKQLDAIQRTKTIEDVKTIAQVTRDVAKNIIVKHKPEVSRENLRLPETSILSTRAPT